MRRRELLAGALGLGVVGLGATAVARDWTMLDAAEAIDPVTLPVIETQGSPGGTMQVPEPGRVTYVEFFATWCGVCRRLMGPLGAVQDDLDDSVQFVSVTNEPLGQTTTADDVAEWWETHDGNWPVAHDDELVLSQRLDATGVPYGVVLDAENRLISAEQGYKTADEIHGAIEMAR